MDLARYFATAYYGQRYPNSISWSHKIIWGNHELKYGAISPTANAFKTTTVWGAEREEDGDNIVWGTDFGDFNIVWGTDCGGEDCDNIVWGTSTTDENGFNIVWGTNEDGDNIVWGTSCLGEDCFNIVWGTECAGEDCDNIVWGTADSDMVLFDDPNAAPVEEPVVSAIEHLIEPTVSSSTTTASGGQL